MPKINQTNYEVIENTVFTDRVDARKIFWEKYDTLNWQKDCYEVINYYGIPGIGKSRLCERLQEEMLSKGHGKDFLFLDFENHMMESHEYLEWLAIKLNAEQKCLFPLFSYALSYFYAKRLSEDKKETSINKYLDTKHPYIYRMIEPLINATGFIPEIGTWSSVLMSVVNKYSDIVKKQLLQFQKEIVLLDLYNSEKIENRLTYFFSQDLKKHFGKREKPFVIFMDTYDRFYNELNSIGDISNKDNWLKHYKYGIVDKIPNVLWVILGREEIKWNDYNKEIQITKVPLEDFEESDTNELLVLSGIKEYEIREKIKEVSNGLPLHISLCIEHYYELINREVAPSKEAFDYSYRELLREFVKYMNEEEQDIVYLMSCLKKWNRETFISQNIISFFAISQTAYNRIMKLSFVLSDVDGNFYLHQEANAVLLANCPKNIKEMYDNYIDKRHEQGELTKEEEYQYIYDRTKEDLEDIDCSSKEWSKWLLLCYDLNFEYIYKCLNDYEYIYFEGIYNLFVKKMEEISDFGVSADENSYAQIYAKIMSLNTVYLERTGKRKEAYQNQIKIVKLLEQIEVQDKEELLTEKYRLLSIQLLLPKNIEKWTKLTENLLEDCRKELGEQHELTIGVAYIVEYMQMVKRLKFEIDIVKKFVNEEVRMYGKFSPRGIKAYMNLALAYKMNGKFNQAIKIGEETCKNMDTFLEEEDLDYIHARDNLVIAYIWRGRERMEKNTATEYEREKAKNDFKRALELALENYRVVSSYYADDEEDMFPYLYQIISSYVCLRDFLPAEEYCIKALNCISHQKHIEDGSMDTIYDTLATIYKIRREYNKAAFYAKQYYDSRCKLHGKNDDLALKLKEIYQQYEKWAKNDNH